jgi:hypothetical protein
VGSQFGRLEVPSSVRKNQSEIGFGNKIGFSIFLRIGTEPKLESHFLKNYNWICFNLKRSLLKKNKN